MLFHFSSFAKATELEAVEYLLYFNAHQRRACEGIQYSIERFGPPKIIQTDAGLSVGLDSHETQTIFAFDTRNEDQKPAGLVVYLRDSVSSLGIVHIAVHPDYAHGGFQSASGLTFLLIDEVLKVARKIKGIDRVLFFYHGEHVLAV